MQTGGGITPPPRRQIRPVGARCGRPFALHFDLAAVLLNNCMDDRQSQPSAVIFCGKKWIEQMLNVFGLDSFTGIANGDVKNFTRFAVAVGNRSHPFFAGVSLCAHGEFAAMLHCLYRIDEEIEKDLFELICISADCIHIRFQKTS
jgi:hypothetical protein